MWSDIAGVWLTQGGMLRKASFCCGRTGPPPRTRPWSSQAASFVWPELWPVGSEQVDYMKIEVLARLGSERTAPSRAYTCSGLQAYIRDLPSRLRFLLAEIFLRFLLGLEEIHS